MRWNVVLFLVSFHTLFISVIVLASFGSDANVVVVKELHTFHVMLESAVRKLSDISLVRKLKPLAVLGKDAKIALKIILCLCVEL